MIAPHLINVRRRRIGYWMLGCAGMVYGAVAIGGLTRQPKKILSHINPRIFRLTESGLSMVNWDLFRTMLPPMSTADWEFEYERYKKYPEYEQWVQLAFNDVLKFAYFSKNSFEPMTMAQFKFIWTMEYLHRMWGRAIGLVFFLPMAGFWMRGMFTRAMKIRMSIALGLIGAQVLQYILRDSIFL